MNKKLKNMFIFAVLISNSFTMGGENKKVNNNKIHFENNFMKQLSLEDNESKNETSILLKLNYDILLPEFDESEELLTNENRKNEINKLKKFYTEKNNEIVGNLDLSNYENVYVSSYSPFISLNTNWNNNSYDALEYLAENDNIQDIYVTKNDETKNNFYPSKRVVGLNNYIYNNDPNYTGEGIVVGILETGIADVKHESLKNTDIEVRDEWYYVETVSNHTTMMAAMIAGVEGVAPKAKVLSVELFGDPVSEIDWLLERNVNVINMSFGEKNPEGKYNSFSAYIDFVVNTYKVTVVASAGNEGNGTKNVANPGLGYNVLTIGACGYDSGLAEKFSSSNVVEGPRKPTIVAPGADYALEGFSDRHNGTSFSCALTTGCVALLMQRDPLMRLHPERVISMFTSTAVRANKRLFNAGLDNRTGAGTLNFDNIVKSYKNHYLCGISVEDRGTTFTVNAEINQTVRIAIAWLAKANGNVDKTIMTDYDLYIYDKDGTLVTKQETNSDCLELAEFTAPSTGRYTAKIVEKSTGRDFDQSVSVSYFIK